MAVKNLCIMVTPGYRSRAYLQNLAKHDLMPEFAIVFNEKKRSGIKFANRLHELLQYYKMHKSGIFSKSLRKYYDLFEGAITTLEKNEVPYMLVNAKGCNDKEVIKAVKSRKEKFFIYTGGGILKKEILATGKKFIHVHPGIVPDYRGSTCFYYSILKEGNCGATAFFMEEAIDTGNIIMQKKYEKPDYADIDNIFDPYMRSDLLVQVIKKLKNGKLIAKKQDLSRGEVYFVIHPVLKHIAILHSTNNKQ